MRQSLLAIDSPQALLVSPTPGFWTMVEDGFFARWIPEVIEMQMEQDPIHHHKDVHSPAVTKSSPPDLRDSPR